MKYFKHENGSYMEVDDNIAVAMERFGFKEIDEAEYKEAAKLKKKTEK